MYEKADAASQAIPKLQEKLDAAVADGDAEGVASVQKQIDEHRKAFDHFDDEPAKELMRLLERSEFSIVVLGRRPRRTVLRSRDLAERLPLAGCAVPVLVAPGTGAGP